MKNKFICPDCGSKIPCSAYNFGNECEEEIKYREKIINSKEPLPTKNQEMSALLKEILLDLQKEIEKIYNQSY